MSSYSLRPLTTEELPAFSQYLLPRAAQALAAGEENLHAFGLVTGRCSAGAVCASAGPDGAVLTSLFVDPALRRQGAGGALLDRAAESCRAAGARTLRASYTLSGGDLTAMDRLFARRGAAMDTESEETFRMDSAAFHDMPLIRGALRPDFRPAPAVRRFCDLTREQLDVLAADPEVPAFLSPQAYAGQADPALSLAFVENGRVTAYTLACDSPDNGCVQLSTVRTSASSPVSILALVRGLVNLMYYRHGGDFPFYTSTVSPESRALVERLAAGRYTLYGNHSAVLSL